MSHLTGAPLGERRYLVPQGSQQQPISYHNALTGPPASEDLHAWSIYRQNLNSDFTDSALGSSDKSPLPYGNFQLRDTTVQSILSHPRYGPKSALGSNMYTYLKFGLPRVFPPNHGGVRDSQRSRAQQRHHQRPATRGRVNRGYVDGSSGYDSSDNEINHQIKMQRKYRSDPDFLSQAMNRQYNKSHLGTGIPLVALQQAASRVSIGAHSGYHPRQMSALRGNRSMSEANLLSPSVPNNSQRKRESRKSSMIDEGGLGNEFEKHSRIAESITSTGHAASVREYGQSIQGIREGIPYPNLQCLNLEIPCNPLSLIGVSLQARAGDLIAVMATVERQGTALLEGIAGVRKRIAGDILLNGQHVNITALRSRVAWSPYKENPLNPFVTVFSTLTYYSQLKYPLRGKSGINDRINILIEELGLEQVRDMAVNRLTDSEVQRLSVACQLLQDTAILVLDQPTKGMDIFDTFFLVEYLRQYASSGCIVILTLQPPTSEIFSMCTAVVLLSSGRVMYSGYRGGFVDHFSRVGYPCPPYKNPSDYYLDLVTLDDLSAAAMLESSGRIESLADNWMAIGTPSLLTDPPASLPDAIVKPNVIIQTLILFKAIIIYSQPHTIINWALRIFLAAVMSVIIGATFWDLPSSDPQLNLNDRLGYHYTVTVVCIWPILICLVYEDLKHIQCIERDIKMGMFGRFTYILVKILISIPACLVVWLTYLIPAHIMTGLFTYQKQNANFYNGLYDYVGFMLLYLMVIQIFITFLAYTVKSKMFSILLGGLIFSIVIIPNGYIIHSDDVISYLKWLEYISPLKWILPIITAEEFSDATISKTASTLLCRNKQHQDIIIQQLCPPPNGTNVQATFHLLPRDHVLDHMNMTEITVIALVATYFVFLIFIFISFISNCASMFSPRRKLHETSI